MRSLVIALTLIAASAYAPPPAAAESWALWGSFVQAGVSWHVVTQPDTLPALYDTRAACLQEQNAPWVTSAMLAASGGDLNREITPQGRELLLNTSSQRTGNRS
jgi:hypothetical protein